MAVRDIHLPEIGEGVSEGELVKWLVKPGDLVVADQAIAELMTDKATVEVPSPVGGVVKELKQKEGDVVNVGAAMIALEVDAAAAARSPPPRPRRCPRLRRRLHRRWPRRPRRSRPMGATFALLRRPQGRWPRLRRAVWRGRWGWT